ncbi:MAG: phage terminase large subunit family protein [Phycisphaerae bacterium]|nr:phage terminase large subunit family protein [Phycisphaerae bacterium]
MAKVATRRKKEQQAAHHREAGAKRSRQQYSAVADIGELPRVVDPARKKACRLNLLLFLESYFPHSTGLKPFSDDHKRVIARFQNCVLNGGRLVEAVYRGFAKTTIGENGAIWATLYGHAKFAPIFGAGQNEADQIIDSIKLELETNDLLMEDFPEVCHPIRCLEGKPQRAASQTHGGQRTFVEWTAQQIVLPTIKGSIASGAIIRTKGITGAARGMRYKRPDGTVVRPDLIIIDDPQSDESAANPLQVNKRLGTLRKAIAKLGAHLERLAIIVNATVIAKDDMIDQLLTRKENAIWQGERIPMVKAWGPAHETLWRQYADLRTNYDAANPDDQRRAHRDATEFYAAHRAEMNTGCQVSWEYCYTEGLELSAVQHAYNILIDDGEEAFASECQQQPHEPAEHAFGLKAAQVAGKLNGLERRQIPARCEFLAAHIDVHDELLYWTVMSSPAKLAGFIVDYGTFPDQATRHFALRDVRRKLADAVEPGAVTKQAVILAGVAKLMRLLSARTWVREDGASIALGAILVDSGYMPEQVRDAIVSAGLQAVAIPSRGRGITAGKRDLSQWEYKPGDRRGHYWGLFRRKEQRLRTIEIDANYWKSTARDGFLAPLGDPGSISLWGTQAEQHRLIADHCAAEYPQRMKSVDTGREKEEWALKPDQDNHFLDNIVGCLAALSYLGARMPGQDAAKPRRNPMDRPAAGDIAGRRAG